MRHQQIKQDDMVTHTAMPPNNCVIIAKVKEHKGNALRLAVCLLYSHLQN